MKLWRYIQGYRKGKDAHRLEKEAMRDPFLAHALRGYDGVEGDHTKQIELLQKEVRRKNTPKVRYLRAAGIAASILLVIGLGTYIVVNESHVQDNLPVALFQEIEPEQSIPNVPPPVIAQQKKIDAPKPPAVDVVEEETESVAQSVAVPVEKELQVDVLETPLPVPVDSIMSAQGIMDLATEQDEVVITGYRTERKQTLTGAVAGVAVTRDTVKENAATNSVIRIRGKSAITPSKVKGKVTDEHGEPIIGASVQVVGTNQGAITDTEGFFELETSGGIIRVSYLGYETLDTLIRKDEMMNLAMNEDKSTLDEVVVVGYGTQRKSVLKEPKPVGGMRKYKKYIKENIIRPTDDECADVKGKVVLQFHVYSNGRPERITVKESLCPSADEEAIRLVTEGPDWKPGNKETTLEIEF